MQCKLYKCRVYVCLLLSVLVWYHICSINIYWLNNKTIFEQCSHMLPIFVCLFWLFLQRKLYCFHLVHGLEEGAARWLKCCLVAAGRSSSTSPCTLGMPEGPFKGCWPLEASSHAWGWAFCRDTRLAQSGFQPTWGG